MELEVPLSWGKFDAAAPLFESIPTKTTSLSLQATLLVPSTKPLTLGTLMLCAIRLPHTNILTLHTILRVYINTVTKYNNWVCIVVVVWMYNQHYKFLLSEYDQRYFCTGKEAT